MVESDDDDAGRQFVDRLREDAVRLDLDDHGDAARAGRKFVEAQVVARGATALVDDAALVAAELLANARQHGLPPIAVTVSGNATAIRIEVSDRSKRAPVRPAPSTSNMTGRGLALVQAVTARWGVSRDDDGKTVWAELDAQTGSAPGPADREVEQLLESWTDDLDNLAVQPRYTVVLGDVPTDLLIDAKAHIDNLVREFSLAAAGGESGEGEIPPHLARLIETVVHGFSDARDAIKRQALAAAKHGEPRTRLTLHLPASAADAGEAYLAALDEADEYARAARLLTLETPADHRLFRRWYVESVVRQLRQLSAGRPASRVTPFEVRLAREVRQLASAQRSSETVARLQRVTAALARCRTPEDVATAVLLEGVEALDASGGGLLVPAGDGVHLAVPGVVGYGEELLGALREERADAPLPAATALRTSTPIWLETQEERDEQFPALRGFEAATVSMCAVPLMVGDRALGALRFSFSARKLFDDAERQFVLALGAVTAVTLQRTELYEAEREAALDLQRALLPEHLPVVPGWDIASYYSPAGEQEAGGDFYDIIPTTQGGFAAVVGDVMGRGVEAAAAMAQIRFTVRAYTVSNPDPATVFRKVDVFFDSLELSQLVTVLYLLVNPKTGRVLIGNAGHLPPLVIDDDGCHIAATEVGMPFGVGIDDRDSASLELAAGTVLVAFTDGLVERRGEDIDEGLRRVMDALHDAASMSSQAILNRLVAAASPERAHDDDVTVLVLRRE